MRNFAEQAIKQAAEKAGIAPEKVMDVSASDNLTIPRPRIECQFLPESWKRTGRKLGIVRKGRTQTRKRELYEVNLTVTANILAEDNAWLSAFKREFIKAFPPGANDDQGNFVKIRVQEASFTKPASKRVGTSAITVFTKVNDLLTISFVWRLTQEETDNLIHRINILPPEWREVTGEKQNG